MLERCYSGSVLYSTGADARDLQRRTVHCTIHTGYDQKVIIFAPMPHQSRSITFFLNAQYSSAFFLKIGNFHGGLRSLEYVSIIKPKISRTVNKSHCYNVVVFFLLPNQVFARS